jgi:uncharacterized protein YaaN involved in tellurite resistance
LSSRDDIHTDVPQIRLIQNNDSLMAEKIQTSIVNTIPLWKSQMVIALSMYIPSRAMQRAERVTKTTNELLRKMPRPCIRAA